MKVGDSLLDEKKVRLRIVTQVKVGCFFIYLELGREICTKYEEGHSIQKNEKKI